jgi:hypothetical protein
MNRELEDLVLALEAVNNASEGDEAKRLEAIFKCRIEEVLRRHPGVDAQRLKRAVELAHARWVKAQKKFPSV